MRSWQVLIPALLVAFNASAQQASTAQSLPSINLQGSKATGGNTAKSGNAAKGGNTASPSADSTMADLVSRGYEIKAAVPNGGKFVVFMQKDQSAYACEFSSLTDTRCGSLN